MAKRFDVFQELVNLGFVESDPDQFGGVCLTKSYSKEVEVLWYGKQVTSFRVDVWFNPEHTVLKAFYYHDGGRRAFKEKVHLNEKRAYNAIAQTVSNNGYEI